MLLEVVISALIVGLLVVATLTGLSVASSTTADQRRHNQAAVLAAESQEQLRSDPATALEALERTPHTYTQTLDSTTYTIAQTSRFINNATEKAACTTPSEASTQSSSYLQITSAVSWRAANSTYPKVEQTSIVTPPTGSSLEVDILNYGTPEAGVAGVTPSVEYTGVESTLPTVVQGTTNANGCVLFGAIPATAATVSVSAPTGYVTPSGTLTIPPEPVTLAPNITTHREYFINDGGEIEGHFTYEGHSVEGETFVAYNSKLAKAPEYFIGGTHLSYEGSGEEHYTAIAGTPATIAATPHSTSYPTGLLFPFPSSEYEVYAGDCLANHIASVPPEPVLVEPGKPATVNVPMSKVNLTVYTGSSASSAGSPTGEALSVQITNTGCKASTAIDATGPLYVHEQKLSAGQLTDPYQPYGSFSLCVYSAATKENYTVSYANETQTGSTRVIYLAGTSSSTQTVESSPPAAKC